MTGEELKKLRKAKGITQEELSIAIGIPKGTIGRIEFNKDSDIKKVDVLNSINKFFNNESNENGPEVVKPTGSITSTGNNRIKKAGLIPFYNADYIAGNAELYYEDETIFPEYYMDVPEFSGTTAFRAYGDSMEPRIKSGNILFGTKKENWATSIEYGQIFGITCKDGSRYLKYIRRHTDKDFFLLKSENPNYDDMDLPKQDVKNIWLINGWIDKRT